MANVSREHIEVVQCAGGPKPRILGSSIRVEDVVIWHEKLGMSVREILDQYPTITAADVHAALAYYWDHRDEIEDRMAKGDAFLEEMQRKYPGPLREKLKRLGIV
jgi:uncharacterized protein (DUF433 family)